MGPKQRRRRRRAIATGTAAAAVALGALGGTLVTGSGDDGALPAPPATASVPDVTVLPERTGTTASPARPDGSALRLPPARRLFGFSDSTFTYTGTIEALDQEITAERQASDLLAAGANAARLLLSWTDLEPEPGRYDQAYVARMKAFTDRLETAGARVLLVLGVPPRWARADEDAGPSSAIADRDDAEQAYARMAGFVARTWPRAAGIETWNEPNATGFWRPLEPQPERFAQLHKAAAAAIRSAAPGTPVVLAGLATYADDTDEHLRAGTFLRRMYAAGLRRGDYDALGLHVYPIPRDGRAPSLRRGEFADALADFARGHRAADRLARIWVTETGVTTTGGLAMPAERQGDLLVRILRTLYAQPRVDALFVHTLYDPRGVEEDSIERGYGLLQVPGGGIPTAKPAYCAVRALATRPGPSTLCPG